MISFMANKSCQSKNVFSFVCFSLAFSLNKLVNAFSKSYLKKKTLRGDLHFKKERSKEVSENVLRELYESI